MAKFQKAGGAPAPGKQEKEEKEEKETGPAILQVSGLTCHAWNVDNTQVAVSPNNHEILIYSTNKDIFDVKKWSLEHVLEGHSGFVSGVDWSHVSNLIVTCGHDRNAYVWKYDDGESKWVPTLVILRINRGATMVKWSPAGNKFAVSSGAKCVPVCHFEQGNNWWTSKMIKKHKSTVLCLDWCVNNKFIVTGSTDFKCRVFSAYIDGIDSGEDDGFGAVWQKQHTFGEVLAEFDHAKAWVTSVTWSPSAFRISFSGHGSTIHFAQILAGQPAEVQSIELEGRPFLDSTFLSSNVVVAVGFDCNPVMFLASGDDANPQWKRVEELDKPEEEKKPGAKAGAAGPGAFASSRALFAASADKGSDFGKIEKKPEAITKHKNSIMSVAKIGVVEGKVTSKISTAGIDGRLIAWDLKKILNNKLYGF